MSKKKWLIIGGGGYIGRHIVREFISKGVEILVLDDLSKGYIERIPNGVNFINLNCMETLSLNKVLVENKICVINSNIGTKEFKNARKRIKKKFNLASRIEKIKKNI